MQRLSFLTAFALFSAATAAQAHTGHGPVDGFHSGFAHPFAGLDHVAAMLGVGLIASVPGGPGWRAPTGFLTAMLAGFVYQALGTALPMVEVAVAGSVLALGGLLIAARAVPVMAITGAVVLFGFAHGYVHGVEAGSASLAAYGSGFIIATLLLHGGGFGLAMAAGLPERTWLRQGAGAVLATIGLALTLSQAA